MMYAARNADGTWTGASYPALTDPVVAHHATYDETLVPVLELTADENGIWTATEASASQHALGLRVSRFQARAALLGAGLLEAVRTAVAESDDEIIQLAWDESIEFWRMSPAILALAPILGLSDDQVDQLFIAASRIRA